MPLSDLEVLDAILHDIPKHVEGKDTMSLSSIRDVIHAKMGSKVTYSNNKAVEKFLSERNFDWSYGLVGGCEDVGSRLADNFLAGLTDDLENLTDIVSGSGETCHNLSDICPYLEGILSSYREAHYSDDVFSELEVEARHALFLIKVKDYLSSTGEFFNVIDRLKLRRYYRATLLSVKDILNAKLPFDDVGVWLASRVEVPITEAVVESLIMSIYSPRTLFSDAKTICSPDSPHYLDAAVAAVTGYRTLFYIVRKEDAGSVTYIVCSKPSDVHRTGIFLEYAKAKPFLRTGKKSDETMARIHFKEWEESKDRLEYTYLVCSPSAVEDEKVLNLYPCYRSIEEIRGRLTKYLYTEVYKKHLELTSDSTVSKPCEVKTKRTDVRHLRPLIWSKVYKEARSGPCLGCNTILYREDFHIAHIHAHAEGGKESDENLLPLCGGCNVSCSKKHLYQFLLERNPTVAKHHFLSEPDFQKYLCYHVNIASALSYLEVMSVLKILSERLPHWRAELTKKSSDYEHRNSIAVTVIKEYTQRL